MNLRPFHIGDQAMIVHSVNHPELNGEITTICSELVDVRDGLFGYKILLAPETNVRWSVPECLRHHYDGDEPGTLEGTIWEPKPVAKKVEPPYAVEIT